jgi:general secretion pathway protein J
MKRATSRGPNRTACRGFTLVEMMVALALLGLLAVLVFESLRFGQRSYEKAVQRGNESWQTFASQRLIRSLIESAYPQDPAPASSLREYGLQGDERSLAITAPAPFAVGGGGLYRYEIQMRPSTAGEHEVVIRWRPDFANVAVARAEDAFDEEVLLERVSSLHWSYRVGTQDPGRSENGGWMDSWQNQSALPRLVRLRVKFASSDPRRWPDLIIAPRITDDANCAFDVVAQRCRRDAS